MTPNAKKLLVDIGTFVVLLESWWLIGAFVGQRAEYHVGQQFQSVYLKGSYYNDWLPVITAIAWGLGWGIALLVIAKNNSKRMWIFLILIATAFCSLLLFSIGNLNPTLVNDLMDPSITPFFFGIIAGSFFARLRNLEKDMHD